MVMIIPHDQEVKRILYCFPADGPVDGTMPNPLPFASGFLSGVYRSHRIARFATSYLNLERESGGKQKAYPFFKNRLHFYANPISETLTLMELPHYTRKTKGLQEI
jgi:hypothetical protein